MLEAILAQKLDEEFLGEIGIGGRWLSSSTNSPALREALTRDGGKQCDVIRPESIYIRAPQAIHPLATLRHPFRCSFCAAVVAPADGSRLNFFFDFVT